MLDTSSLTEFINAQSRLSSIELRDIELETPGMGWRVLAQALPPNVDHWYAQGSLTDCEWDATTKIRGCWEWHHDRNDLIDLGWRAEAVSDWRTRFTRIGTDG
jgi:hypothetical protein